jgi:hypothetical protein
VMEGKLVMELETVGGAGWGHGGYGLVMGDHGIGNCSGMGSAGPHYR